MNNNPAFRFFLLIALLVGLWLLGKFFHVDLTQVRAWLAQYPLWLSGLLFTVVFVGVTTFFWFGTIDFFRITAALLFGPYISAILIYIAEIFNASILFTLSRKLGREYIEQKFHLKEKDISRAGNNAGFWWALALKMNLLTPQRAIDLVFGLTKIPFPKYCLAVILALPGRVLMIQLFLSGLGDMLLKENISLQQMFEVMFNYFLSHMGVFYFCLANCLIALALMIVAIVFSVMGQRKTA